MKKLMIVVAVAVTGCAPNVWTKPGGTQAESERDIAECRYQASLATAGISSAVEQGLAKNDLGRQCLRLRGYAPQPGSW